MRRARCLAGLAGLALCVLGAAGAAPAVAAPVWHLYIHHYPTNFEPGSETAGYSFDVENVGDASTSGPVTVTVRLPPGTSRNGAFTNSATSEENQQWSCPGSSGDTTVVCTTADSIPRHYDLRNLFVGVDVEAGVAEGTVLASAEVEGGGAASTASATEATPISSRPAPFGIFAPSFEVGFLKADAATPVLESGAHPALARFPFDFNTIPAPLGGAERVVSPPEPIRDLRVDLPPGFLGNPTAVGECTQAQFTLNECPRDSQVGRIDLRLYPISPDETNYFQIYSPTTAGVFNLSHPRGVVTDLGFVFASNPVHIKASLDPANHYAITTEVPLINETVPAYGSRLTLWGVPADHSHDSERCGSLSKTAEECPTDHEKVPFLTTPSRCGVDHIARIFDYDSWQHPGVYGTPIDYTLPDQTTHCEKPRFEPDVSIEPTGHQANTPTGLNVHIEVPQNENPDALGTPPVKSTVVTLPEGMTVNPAFAEGLAGCTESQIGLETDDPVECPDNSRIGEVQLRSPLLPNPIEGSMYLARQEENPFGSLLAVYLALHDTEERGVLVKVAGKISLDSATGQITTSFDQLPELPFEDLTLKFRSGDRAPLVNPPTCGTHAIAATMTSYARPGEAVGASNSFSVSEGPGGGACQGSLGARPFDPSLVAGTLNPVAGAFSPLALRVFRSDADQELSTVEGAAPAGLTASLRGVGRCSEAQIATAAARSHPGEGALEQAHPSCPADSQVGTVQAGAGAGPSPIYVPGKIYLAGPYEGAPASGVAIVPAVAGPVDLGDVVVRAPAYIDPRTAQITIKSDPLPQIVNGVLIRTRDVRINLDRPRFSLNPTSCEPMSIAASLRSTEGATKLDSERFQVGSCASLGFKPRLRLKLRGGTRRGRFPALKAVYRPRGGDANASSLVVRLPHSAFIEQGHFRTICTRVQFAAAGGDGAGCPPASAYGHVIAYTPILDQPLEGPVYLRSSSHNLPDMVLVLHGPPSLPVRFEAVGRIDSARGGIRSTFEGIPDVPLSAVVLEMEGGRKGLIVNSTDLCKGRHRARASYTAHNGKRVGGKPLVRAVKCKQAHRKRHARHRRGAKKGR